MLPIPTVSLIRVVRRMEDGAHQPPLIEADDGHRYVLKLSEERFNHGSDACIVCTSTLELGIDVGDLDRVLQAEAPDTVSAFLQRMGRTGRREGQSANTTFFCESSEGVLQAIALVELGRAGWVENVAVVDRCWPVLIHQLLVMALASDGVEIEAVWSHLSGVSDFRGIHRAEFDRLVAWIVRDGALRLVSGLLVLGPKAEKRFGRKNFMELYAVFSSPQSYAVVTTAEQPLGTLSQGFVDRLVEGVSPARRARVAGAADPPHRSPGPRAAGTQGQAAHLGWVPAAVPRVRGLSRRPGGAGLGSAVWYLHPSAADVLQERRDAFSDVFGAGGRRGRRRGAPWWTFAGGAWRFVAGRTAEAPSLRGVPGALLRAVQRAPEPEVETELPPTVEGVLPIRWVRTTEELAEVCAVLASEPWVGLDTETTLRTQTLCLVQLAGAGFAALVDALAIADLSPLAQLCADERVAKIVHFASFERGVLGKYGITLLNVVDTCALSREVRGAGVDGGHGLKAVAGRELGVVLDKEEQVSDWTRRPLTRRQEAYAALDAEVLLAVRSALLGADNLAGLS